MSRHQQTRQVVRVEHRAITSTFRGLDARGFRVLQRALPASARQLGDAPGELVVTRGAAAVDALRHAGFTVVESDDSDPQSRLRGARVP